MKSFVLCTAALAASLLPTAFAQTFTDCNPLNTTGCPDMPALGGNATFAFNDTINDNVWNYTNGKPVWSEKGQTFVIKQRGDSPTIKSNFYIFFGRVSVIMKAAPGKGVVSTFILQSEDLDEIDFEFLGSNTKEVLTNYYGKGNITSSDRGKNIASAAPQDAFHNYTLHWTKESTQWWIDDKMVRELKFGDALGGKNYPQTPMTLRMGIWAAGDVKNNDPGVVEWAGGETDFSQAPFTMTVQEVYVEDFTTAKTYQWGDQTGSYQGIKVVDGKSAALAEIQKPHGAKNRWNALSKGAQIGIIIGVLSVVGIGALAIFFYFLKQRRAGRREYNKQAEQDSKEAAELMAYKNHMQSGRFAQGSNYP